jgi:hypothetical protein
MECHSKVSLEVNKAQALMKLSTKREVPCELSTTKLKTFMDKKNLMPQANASVNPATTTAEQPVELVELSKETYNRLLAEPWQNGGLSSTAKLKREGSDTRESALPSHSTFKPRARE